MQTEQKKKGKFWIADVGRWGEQDTGPIVIMGQDFKACCAWAEHLHQLHCTSDTSKTRYNFHRKIKQQLTLLRHISSSLCQLMQEISTQRRSYPVLFMEITLWCSGESAS